MAAVAKEDPVVASEDPAIFVTMIGKVAFATPTPKPDLTPVQLKAIELAFIAADEGRTGAAELHIRRVERRLWPKGFDPHHVLRLMRVANDPGYRNELRLGVREVRFQRQRSERRHVAQLGAGQEAPAHDKAMANDIRKMDESQAKLDAFAEGKRQAGKGEKKALLEDIRVRRLRIKAAHEAQVTQRWAGHSVSETTRLASSRGEEVQDEATEVPEWVRDENGALVKGENDLPILKVERAKTKRVLSRSGLDLAFVRGDLGEGREAPMRLLLIGRRYGVAFASAVARTTPEAKEIRSSSIPEPQMAALMAWDELNALRGDKEGLEPMSRRQRDVLDRVCGLDMTIGATAQAMKAGVPSIRRALRGGLMKAEENVRPKKEVKR